MNTMSESTIYKIKLLSSSNWRWQWNVLSTEVLRVDSLETPCPFDRPSKQAQNCLIHQSIWYMHNPIHWYTILIIFHYKEFECPFQFLKSEQSIITHLINAIFARQPSSSPNHLSTQSSLIFSLLKAIWFTQPYIINLKKERNDKTRTRSFFFFFYFSGPS